MLRDIAKYFYLCVVLERSAAGPGNPVEEMK